MGKNQQPAFRPRLPDASDGVLGDNTFVLSDNHGDAEGAKNALKESGFNPDKHQLVINGDLVDRGNDSPGMLNLARNYGAKLTMGNHENWHIRNVNHMANAAATGAKNPMVTKPEMQDTINQFGPSYMESFRKLRNSPLYLPFESNALGKGNILHAGVHPDQPLDEQDSSTIMVRRHHPMPGSFMSGESDEFPYWQRAYQKPTHGFLVTGHNPMQYHDQRSHGSPYNYNLDGGAYMGDAAPWGQGVHRVLHLGTGKVTEHLPSQQAVQNYRRILANKST